MQINLFEEIPRELIINFIEISMNQILITKYHCYYYTYIQINIFILVKFNSLFIIYLITLLINIIPINYTTCIFIYNIK